MLLPHGERGQLLVEIGMLYGYISILIGEMRGKGCLYLLHLIFLAQTLIFNDMSKYMPTPLK